jgi:hypothetical protein
VVFSPLQAYRNLEGAREQRSELRNQLDRLEGNRRELTEQLQDAETPAASRAGIEARLKDVDARIRTTDELIAQADLNVAKLAAVPGATEAPRAPRRDGPPEEMFAIPIVFTIFVLAPIAIAFARRIWKRGATAVAPVPSEVRDRLDQLGMAVESISVEVERIGEGQRFLTKVMSEQSRALGAGPAQPIAVPQAAEAVPVARRG